MRILIVEDEVRLARLLALELEHAGFDAETVMAGYAALDRVVSGNYDCLVLDVMLPDISGFEVCRRVHQLGNTPIIMVTARGQVPDKVAGLELGADDYMVKPVNAEELAARIRAVVRRHQSAMENSDSRYEMGNLVLSPTQHRVTVDDEEATLTPMEFRMLEHFLAQVNRVQSREELLDGVWGTTFTGDTNLVDVNVGRLRRRLRAAHANVTIETIRGFGYVLRQNTP